MVTTLNEGIRPLEFLLSEAENARSRQNVVFTGALIQPGTVCGKITTGGKFGPLTLTGSTGQEVAAAIACYKYDASAADVAGVVVDCDCEVIGDGLIWPVGITNNQKAAAIAALRTQTIKVR